MKNLSTLFAIATLATTLSVAGCNKKKSDQASQPAAAEKTSEGGPAATPSATTPPAGDQAKTAAPDQAAPATGTAPAAAGSAAPAAATDLPKECQDYKADIEKLSTCNKLPQSTRDSLKQAYDTASSSWTNMAPEAKANLASACKAGAQAVEESAKSACGW